MLAYTGMMCNGNSETVVLFTSSGEKGPQFGGAVRRTEGKWKIAKAHQKTQKKECTER
jgi:hypothetical protein